MWKGFEFLRPAVEARPIRAPVADPHRISLIDIDGVRLGPIARQVQVRSALGLLRWNLRKSRYYISERRTRVRQDCTGRPLDQRENRFAEDSSLEGDGFEPLVRARELRSPAGRQSPFLRRNGTYRLANFRAALLGVAPSRVWIRVPRRTCTTD